MLKPCRRQGGGKRNGGAVGTARGAKMPAYAVTYAGVRLCSGSAYFFSAGIWSAISCAHFFAPFGEMCRSSLA